MSILVVGAGFTGATIARTLAEAGYFVHVVDKRPHVGGNAHDEVNEHGIRVHTYGPHIFHTSNSEVVDFLSRFTEWIVYEHVVKAQLADGTHVPFPPNADTIVQLGEMGLVSGAADTEALLDIFFRPYTFKMWGKTIEELDPSILQRVPIKDTTDPRYFPKDKFQAMPKDGYTSMIMKMLAHQNIVCTLGCDYKDISGIHSYDHVFCSAPIDVHFDSCFGDLPYRSIKFHEVDLPFPKLLPTPVVNFTTDGLYTRVTEWKQFPAHGENPYGTTITFEEPCDYRDNNLERYYPVKDAKGEFRELYKRYSKLAEAELPNWTFVGRLGNYAYLDMHQAVNSALAVAENYIMANATKGST